MACPRSCGSISLLEERGHDCRIYARYQGLRRDLDGDRRGRRRAPTARSGPRSTTRPTGMRPAHAVVRHVVADRLRRPVGADPRHPLLPRPGLRAVVLPGRQQRRARRGDLPLRLPRHHRRAAGSPTSSSASTAWPATASTSASTSPRLPGRRRPAARCGVVFFARPDTPRRGFELGMLALELFAGEHPEVEIHVIGAAPARRVGVPFPFIDHGHLPGRPAGRPLQPLPGRSRPVAHEPLAAARRAARRRVPPGDERRASTPGRRATARWPASRRPSRGRSPRRSRASFEHAEAGEAAGGRRQRRTHARGTSWPTRSRPGSGAGSGWRRRRAGPRRPT